MTIDQRFPIHESLETEAVRTLGRDSASTANEAVRAAILHARLEGNEGVVLSVPTGKGRLSSHVEPLKQL